MVRVKKLGNKELGSEETKRREETIKKSLAATQTPLQRKASEQGVPLTAFKPEDLPRREFQAAVQQQAVAPTSVTAETVNKRQEALTSLETEQEARRLEANRNAVPETAQERAEARASQATQDVLGAFIDPFAPIVERGQEAVASSQPGVLQDFNIKALEVTESLRAAYKKASVQIYKQVVGRGLGRKKELTETYTEMISRKSAAVDGMKELITNLQTGVPVSNPVGLFNKYADTIYGDYRNVKLLVDNDLDAYLEDGSDTYAQLDTAVNSEIPQLETEFNAALVARAII